MSDPVVPTNSTLKSKYYQYLEALCSANGIDIQSLKNGAIEVDELEMFFGGLPALIGLRYFDKLRILRLMSQDVTSLVPLSEIADSLEELWVCEGTLKDLSGLETCKQLRRLYLYDCRIEDGTPIGSLVSLDVLWIQNNRLSGMEFLDSLQFLTMLKAGGEQFTDAVALSVEKWPSKLQHLDIDGNQLTSVFLHLCACEVIRYFDLCSGKYAPGRVLRDDRQYAWLAYHFPFLERVNLDVVQEKFITCNTTIAETAWYDEFNRAAKAERQLWITLTAIEKNYDKICEKLTSFLSALAKSASTVTKSEGRREFVVKLQEQSQLRLKTLKKVKAGLIEYEKAMYTFANYLLPSWQLESAYQSPLRELSRNELQLLEDVLQSHCMKSDEPKIRVRYALTFVLSAGELNRSEVNTWLHAECPPAGLWNLRALVELCDRRLCAKYCTSLRLYKDIMPFCNNAQNTEAFVLAPLMRPVQAKRTLGHDDKNDPNQNEEVSNANVYESQGNRCNKITTKPFEGNDKSTPWQNIELAAVCFLEFHRTAQVQLEELANWNTFDDRFNEQVNKLRDVGIDLKFEKAIVHKNDSMDLEKNEEIEDTVTEVTTSTKSQKLVQEVLFAKARIDCRKDGKAVDYFDADLPTYRWRTKVPCWSGKQLSLRNSLELTIAYTRGPTSFEKTEFYQQVTCLDLSDCRISKLDGLEYLVNLHCLNLAENKLNNVKKLKALRGLTFLDISGNQIAKIDELPGMINELHASRNLINCLQFCTKLSLLTRLNMSKNKLKSLKGIEQSKLLQTVILSDNQIKEKTEIEIFSNFPKLCFVDLSGNPAAEIEGHRKRLLCIAQNLIFIDYEKIPVEERHHVVRKSGKVLTFEFIEKLVPELEAETSLNLSNNQFQMIALDRTATSKLQHITDVDISHNELEFVYEIVELHSLKRLNLSHNQIVALSSSDFGVNPDAEILPELEELDLSFNNLNCQGLARIGFEKLPKLRKLNLRGNVMQRFDGAQFDFPNLEEVDASHNEIRSIRKKTMSHLLVLNLANNRLKELDGLEVPRMRELNLANNRIGSCAALKSVKTMRDLKTFNCLGNPVTERRVYHEFVKGSLKHLEQLDAVEIQRTSISAANQENQTTKVLAVDSSITQAPSLPSLVKLANAQSSEFQRYHTLLQKSKQTTNQQQNPQRNDDPVEDILKARGQTTVTYEKRRSISNAQLRRTKSTVNAYYLPSNVIVPANFVVAGTRAVKHYRSVLNR
ncbi:Leucine-rich repeat-containing protein [Aphelenchoides besseyi]|nr:Leucine-rich repeat-containing protein [Aphelenchoides besseyi]